MAIEPDTLIYNSGKLEELSQTIGTRLKEFIEHIDAMFNIIDVEMNQPDHWSGTVYEDLKTKCDNFRATRIETMASNLKAYVNHFHRTSEESEETTTAVKGIVTRDAEQNANAVKPVVE